MLFLFNSSSFLLLVPWAVLRDCGFLGVFNYRNILLDQGPVIKSVVSLTSSLVVKNITVLINAISNSQVLFAEKMQKLLTFFQQNIYAYMPYLMIKVLTLR